MSETDSFIDEVSEEVRRDRLFGFFKKYAWVFIGLVVLIVGGAAYNEYQSSITQRAAQAAGEALIAASESGSSADFAAIGGNDIPSGVLAKFEQAAILAQEGQAGAAADVLDQIAVNAEAPQIYRDLALLKIVMINGANMEEASLEQIFDKLTGPESFFAMLAYEQRAIYHLGKGDRDAALEDLAVILASQNVTQGLLNRAQELTIALGGELETPDTAVTDG